jgi:hypothetical protein
VYKKSDQIEILNARTNKPIVKKAPVDLQSTAKKDNNNLEVIRTDNGNRITYVRREYSTQVNTDEPFSTKSAACAYDKKHERLYYTPMGINQLRYIDLKSKSPRIYYFEEEAFGVVKGSHNVEKQITRMVIASDGNGYALTNDAQHLIRFTTGKKPTITDLGPITDDGINAVSIQDRLNYGGDMIADTKKNLYFISANRKVYKINIENKVAVYQGSIKGLPKGFTTNGAVVENGNKVIVSSSNSTEGYYRFSLKTLQAEKVSTNGAVFNASDLANANLASDKEEKKEEKEPEIIAAAPAKEDLAVKPEVDQKVKISVFPNPVTNGIVKLLFEDQPTGRYQVQFMDIAGKVFNTQAVSVESKWQVNEFRLSELNAKGNYLVRVVDADNKVIFVNKLIVP